MANDPTTGYPPQYQPAQDFSAAPFQKADLDPEFDALALTGQHVRALLMKAFRDDWKLADASVPASALAFDIPGVTVQQTKTYPLRGDTVTKNFTVPTILRDKSLVSVIVKPLAGVSYPLAPPDFDVPSNGTSILFVDALPGDGQTDTAFVTVQGASAASFPDPEIYFNKAEVLAIANQLNTDWTNLYNSQVFGIGTVGGVASVSKFNGNAAEASDVVRFVMRSREHLFAYDIASGSGSTKLRIKKKLPADTGGLYLADDTDDQAALLLSGNNDPRMMMKNGGALETAWELLLAQQVMRLGKPLVTKGQLTGLSGIQFADWNPVLSANPNGGVFTPTSAVGKSARWNEFTLEYFRFTFTAAAFAPVNAADAAEVTGALYTKPAGMPSFGGVQVSGGPFALASNSLIYCRKDGGANVIRLLRYNAAAPATSMATVNIGNFGHSPATGLSDAIIEGVLLSIADTTAAPENL